MRLTIRIALGLAALAIAAAPLDAQTAGNTSIIVGVPDRFPPVSVDAMVVRQAGQDAILFRVGTVTVDALRMALLALTDARAARPTPDRGELIPIVGYDADDLESRVQRRWFERVVARLTDAPTRDLGTFGPGRGMLLPGNPPEPR